FMVVVREVNSAPVLTVPADQTINELSTLVVTNTASDADLPANTLSFGLVSAPTGVLLDANTGVLSWTPTEAQGPSTNLITVRVTDNGAPPLSATNSFTVVVREVNSAPVLTVPADQTINELSALVVTNTASDADLPTNTLSFGLVSAPTGVLLGANAGVLTCSPTEAQGPSTNLITVRETDIGTPPLCATPTRRSSDREVNSAPVLTVPADQTINELSALVVTNTASDADLPTNTLSFGLVSAPTGVLLGANAGVLTCSPTEAQGPSTNLITVRETDIGTPPLCATPTRRSSDREVNSAPVLAVPADQTINELSALVVTNTASDADLPANTLSFGLVAAPTGVLLDANTGVLSWTPTEAQGPSTNLITVRVTDNGAPPLSATNSFTVVVREVNSAPVLTVPADQTISELSGMVVIKTAINTVLPTKTLSCGLVSAPTGVLLDANTGVLSRTFPYTTLFRSNLITVRVTDNGAPPLSATNSFTVVVREVNSAPVLTVPADQTISE